MIGEEVRRRREVLRLTGAQLAGRAGMAPSAVSQIETGKRTPTSTSVIKLAAALGVEVGDLYPKGQAPLPFDDSAGEVQRPADASLTLAERLERNCGHADLLFKDEGALADLIGSVDSLMVDGAMQRLNEELTWLREEHKKYPATVGWPWRESFTNVLRKYLAVRLIAARRSRENQEALNRLIGELEGQNVSGVRGETA